MKIIDRISLVVFSIIILALSLVTAFIILLTINIVQNRKSKQKTFF